MKGGDLAKPLQMELGLHYQCYDWVLVTTWMLQSISIMRANGMGLSVAENVDGFLNRVQDKLQIEFGKTH